MGNLIRAEFRKIFTTKLWWALLIPTVVLALGWSWIWAALATSLSDKITSDPEMQQLGVSVNTLPLSVFGFARAINISTIFPMIMGGLALSSEISRRTITTSYLTAPSRVSLLTSKLITYVVFGLLYGVVITAFASLGIAIGSDKALLPDVGGWALMASVGILETLLWTLLAIGVGALIGNVVGSVLTLLLYSLMLENLIDLVLPGHWAGILPNGAANGLTGSVASKIFLDTVPPIENPTLRDGVERVVRGVSGAAGAFDWWASGLIFAGWMAVFFGLGWLISQRRDIT
ncbi:ABC transporter permease subunit [Solihabitans fulvus]|uniref:ABC transporter permease subunit n=1 Tax=Solihabitans fulvus TaxID=1892852 RepID=A0A5B2WTL0_9PSEU|nr:ABC transporter permease subunit [Solihabitans fulvus]KAA2254328.1 ABC transporter permease subunit [Solihabitans fulvus]